MSASSAFTDMIARLMRALNAHSDAELARALDISPSPFTGHGGGARCRRKPRPRRTAWT